MKFYHDLGLIEWGSPKTNQNPPAYSDVLTNTVNFSQYDRLKRTAEARAEEARVERKQQQEIANKAKIDAEKAATKAEEATFKAAKASTEAEETKRLAEEAKITLKEKKSEEVIPRCQHEVQHAQKMPTNREKKLRKQS